MNRSDAKKLSKYHSFTKKELYEMLSEALEKQTKEYWQKPSYINPIFDNGYYFNQCVRWLNYKPGKNDNEFCKQMISFRVLQCAGKYSKIKLPKRKKIKVEQLISEKPSLNLE